MPKIAIATTSRADYSSLLPVLRLLTADADFDVRLFVSGTHLLPEFGMTIQAIEADGFPIAEKIHLPFSQDTPDNPGFTAGQAVQQFSAALAQHQPDVLLLVGDRLEMLAVGYAALIARIPVAHISGGDVTEGAVDDAVRHALTKLSHVHFVSMDDHARRVRQMGEETWRVHITGDPALDTLRTLHYLNREELAAFLGLPLTPPLSLVTFHPTTLSPFPVETQIAAVLAALEHLPGTLLIGKPNVDSGHTVITKALETFVQQRENTRLFTSLGQQRYYSLLAIADVMLGNSSSGIWEAPSFGLPVVNIGERQQGRWRAANVLDVPAYDTTAIQAALSRAFSPEFRASLKNMPNPYGDGYAAERIVQVLKTCDYSRLLLKKFVNY
jgi:UDP-hydrolysing UDP-N-acetyl-D-glucosamine 2-epimerase